MNEIDPNLDKALTGLQCSALCSILGLMLTIPRNVTLHIAGELRRRDRRRFLTSKYLSKAFTDPEHPLTKRWSRRVTTEENVGVFAISFLHRELRHLISFSHSSGMVKCPLSGSLGYPYHARFSVPLVDSSFGASLNSYKETPLPDRGFPQVFKDSMMPRLIDGARAVSSSADGEFRFLLVSLGVEKLLFIDGSKSPNGPAGFSVYDEESRRVQYCGVKPMLSIFEIEALALFRAVVLIGEKESGTYAVASDSRSCLIALEAQDCKGNAPIYQIKLNLSFLTNRGYRVSLIWIPGHAGICGNDVVGYFAGQVAIRSAGQSVDELDFTQFYQPNLILDLKKSAY